MRTIASFGLLGVVACSAAGGSDPAPSPEPTDFESRVETESTQSVGLMPPPTTGAAKTGSATNSTPKSALNANTLTPSSGIVTYSWSQSQGFSTVMMNQNTGWCFLAKVTGHFVGTGEAVWIANSNGYWVLTGQSQQQGVAAEATCVPWSTIDPGFGSVSYAWNFYAYQSNNCNSCCPNGTCGVAQTNLVGTGSFCTLMGVGGAFAGGGESVAVRKNNTSWTLVVNSLQPNGTEGWAGCFQFNNGQTDKGEFDWNENQSFALVGSTPGACGLSFVRGAFGGSGDSDYTLFAPPTSWDVGATGNVWGGSRCVN